MKKVIVALVVIVILAAGGIYLLLQDRTQPTIEEAVLPTIETTEPAPTEPTESTTETTITYTDSGFSPTTLTVATGSTVVIKNQSNQSLEFESDPHPAHTSNTELNIGLVEPGGELSFVVETPGNYGYHNHLDARFSGTIIVE